LNTWGRPILVLVFCQQSYRALCRVFKKALQNVLPHARQVNAVKQLGADPAGIQQLVVNLCKVNRVEPITLRRVGLPPEEAVPAKKAPKPPHLGHSFAKDLKQLSDASPEALAPYGRLIPDFTVHNEQPGEVPWPGLAESNGSAEGMAGTLCQEFVVGNGIGIVHDSGTLHPPPQVSWKPGGDAGSFLELEFEGLTGSFAGEKGRPGAEYSPELGSYRANVGHFRGGRA
jgi:hypothetical protein